MTQTPHSAPRAGFGADLARAVIRARWLVIALSILVVGVLGAGARNLQILTDYREFFSPQNPELRAFEDFQATYTKTDNLFFLVKPRSGEVFTRETLVAIEDLTQIGWRIPHATRVDSLTNFQHTYATGDDLVVEDLIEDAASLSSEGIAQRKAIALGEPLIRGLLVSDDARAAGVNIRIQLPGETIGELPAVIAAAKDARAALAAKYPGIEVRISGLAALNNAFAEDGPNAFAALMPVMFLVILLLSVLFLRSIAATGAMLLVIMLSTIAAMGIAGFLVIGISPVSAAAPIVILTLAVADSIHIFISTRQNLAAGLDRRGALIEAVRSNLLAVTITSITTIVGFLSLNFSDAPPFRALGNISAIGVGVAWALSLTLFPALVSFIALKPAAAIKTAGLMQGVAKLIVRSSRKLFAAATGAGALMIAFVPSLEINDMFVEYFDERVEFRRDIDAVIPHFGPLAIEYSVPGPGPGGVSDPDYLAMLEKFAQFLREQPKVTHVYALTDIMKRLNRNMHGDDEAYYGIPESQELAAQYLLLYELSLPYGLDLNDRINLDKSASRVSVSFKPLTTQETKALLGRVEAWFDEHAPGVEPVDTGAQVMFTYIADRNLQSMISGTVIGVIGIALVMIAALRSVRLGLLSIVPNALPILAVFGAWALLDGEVGFSIAMIGSISLGIVVDDTVHFLTKYMGALRAHRMSPAQAVEYAVESVGAAIVANTVILAAGFFVLAFASFKPTVDLGVLTGISILFALFFDFLFLPGLLLWVGRWSQQRENIVKGPTHAAT